MKQKIVLLYFFAGIVCAHAFAQPTLKSQRVAGGNDDDQFTSMWLTSDGGVIAGGYSPSNKFAEKTEDSKGEQDYWVIKYDRDGNIQWDKTVGGDSWDRLFALQQTDDGGYILGGYSVSNVSGDRTDSSRGEYDYWIVKMDSYGNIEWDKSIGGTGSDNLSSLQQTKDGGYVLGGTSYSTKSADKTQFSRGGGDYWVVKLNRYGDIIWDKTIGGNGDDSFSALQQTSDGGYILGGYSGSGKSGEKTEDRRGVYDYWVVKINSLGKVEWDKTMGGRTYNFLNCLQQTREGGYLIGGRSDSNIFGEKTENSRGGWDYWIVKLNNTGGIEWDKTIGGPGNENLSALQQTTDGGFVLAGNSTSNISGEKTENSRGGEDYWIVKLDSLRNIQWDKTIGGNDYDVPKSVKEVKENQYLVGGYSKSGSYGDRKIRSRGHVDYWLVGLVKYGDSLRTVSQSETITAKLPENKSNNLFAYPNPAKNTITVNFTAAKSNRYILEFNGINGSVLLRKEIDASQGINHTTFDISPFAKGSYFITITKPDKTKESIQVKKE